MRRWGVLLAIVLLPVAHGAPVLTAGTLQAVHVVDLSGAEIVEIGPTDAPPGRCFSNEVDEVDEPPGMDWGPLIQIDPGGTSFSFAEQGDENGCAELNVGVQVPEGSERVTVRFTANRFIEGGPAAISPGFVQEVWGWPGLERPTGDPEMRAPIYAVDEPPKGFQVHERTMDLPGKVKEVTLAWYFEDATGPAGQFGFPVPQHGPSMGSQVKDILVTYHLPLHGLRVQEKTLGFEAGQRQVETVVQVDIPPLPSPGATYTASFQISNEYGVYGVVTPGGERLPNDQLLVAEREGRLTFTLPPEVIEANGAGTYKVYFHSSQTVVLSAATFPLLGAAIILPLASGVFAQRGVSVAHRATGRRFDWLMAWSIILWMVLASVVAAVIGAGLWTAMMSVPMEPRAQAPYYVMAGVTGLFLALGLFGRRLHAVAMEERFDEVENVRKELERSNRDLEQFAFVASHDLKEPLRMVASYTDLLQRRFAQELPETAKEYVSFAAQGATRMGRMVDDLLVYARIHEQGVGRGDVNLEVIMDLTRRQLHSLIEENRARVTNGALPVVQGNRTQLLQLVQNLVQNAIKFSMPGVAPRVHVGAERLPDAWRIFVKDNGIGVDPKHQTRIFQIFQRVERRADDEGNGIGLALCQRIVESHGGTIGVDSEPGGGATFFFTLPHQGDA